MMQVGLVAFHYPRPEYRDQMLGRVQQASWFIEASPGCLAIDCWLTEDGTAIVSTGKWDSEEAFHAGFAAARAGGVDFTYDDREPRPREVFRLAHV
jgi:heme-degrading monooxygenase HmoA